MLCPFPVQVKKEWEEAEHQAVNLPKAERQTLIQVRVEGSKGESYWERWQCSEPKDNWDGRTAFLLCQQLSFRGGLIELLALFLKLEMIWYYARSFPTHTSRKWSRSSSVATVEPNCNFRPLASFALTTGLRAWFSQPWLSGHIFPARADSVKTA